MCTEDSVAIVLAGRVAVYRICQNLLGNEPTAEALSELSNAQTFEVLSLFSQGSEDYQATLNTLVKLTTEELKNEDMFIDRLSESFTHLFVGPNKLEVDPWESVYRSTDYNLFQPSTLEVRKAYVAQNLIPSAYPAVPDDHLAIELDFMARLAEKLLVSFEAKEAEVAKGLIAASEAFLDKHLLTWVPAFTAAFKEAKHGFFYREVAEYLSSFLPIDQKLLCEVEESLSRND
jgi:TorA maturation chaperone TorD